MAEAINTGTILFKDETLLPDAMQFDSEPCATGWRLVKNLEGYELNRRIHDAGWRFFCIAGEIKSSVFGLEGPKTVREAVKRMLARLKADKFNSLQITRVVSKRFLGVPYVSVTACSRHIQESLILLRDKDFRKLGPSKIDGRPAQRVDLPSRKGLLQGTPSSVLGS